MGCILILGGNKLNRGVLEKFKDRGDTVVFADWNAAPDLTGDRHLQVDVKDADAVLAAVAAAGLEIDFAYTSIDVAVPAASRLNAIANGLTEADARDPMRYIAKGEMTRRWADAGLLMRATSIVLLDETEAVRAKFRGFERTIIKPNIASSSRGITILTRDIVEQHGNALADAVRRAAAQSADGRAIAEEFVEGTEYTAEMLADRDGRIAVYAVSEKAHSPHLADNKVATKLLYNFDDEGRQRAVAQAAAQAFAALEPVGNLGHLELIVADDGRISPLECGFRSSGFIASHLVDAASGRDYLADYRAVLSGGATPEVETGASGNAAMFYFYDLPPGAVLSSGLDIRDHLPRSIVSLTGDRSKLASGARITAVSNDNERPGYEILVGPKDILTMAKILDAEREMLRKAGL